MTRRVSVCMATYNGAPYLREQLDSILSQLGADDELIVSDDHSRDDTPSILAGYHDARIKLFTNAGKRGHVPNFDHAISHASGEFIALSDQDDIWVENRLDRMVDVLREMPPCSLVIGDFTEFDSNGIHSNQTLIGPSPRFGFVSLISLFVGRAKYFGCTFLFRRELTRFIIPIPRYIEAHDIWIAINACIHGKIAHLRETTVMRRLHDNNLSLQVHRGLGTVVRSRVCYVAGLLKTSVR